jgi:hypothetical protein
MHAKSLPSGPGLLVLKEDMVSHDWYFCAMAIQRTSMNSNTWTVASFGEQNAGSCPQPGLPGAPRIRVLTCPPCKPTTEVSSTSNSTSPI